MAEVDPWQRILLRCKVTHARLDDPAKGVGCTHQAVCNFKNLCHRKRCPIAGCAAVWQRQRVKREEELRSFIASAPSGTEVVWRHSDTGKYTFVRPNLSERDVIDVDAPNDDESQPSAQAAVKQEANTENDGLTDACCVCQDTDGSTQAKGLIVFCDGCDQGFHEECYGIRGKIPDGGWLCEGCEERAITPGMVPRCVACPNLQGGLKRTADGTGFAHCICVVHIPELFYSENSETGAPSVFGAVAGYDRVDEARRKYRCVLCEDPVKADQGIKVICGHRSCMNAFHPTCALNAGLDEHEKADRNGRVQQYFHCKEDKHDRRQKLVRRAPIQAGAGLKITQLFDKRPIEVGWAAARS
jgi:hypothetical protein